ncbi:hypothetical protein KL906_003005 [Ogataea polymorpha]|nr:hypothetical protein KL906_003005 [Ogataea polymorpha]KAG7920897.1 hypothetical protein KL927_000141 [Ogataea polymorpha]KAG7939468.1 hypothetical protein KL934_000402 [Ogataea polymorpha]
MPRDPEYTDYTEETAEDDSVGAEDQNARPAGKKYILNSNFNEPSPEHKRTPPTDWMPEVLQHEHWPDTQDASKDASQDPYLSLGETNTLVRRQGGDEAAWRKYKDNRFRAGLQGLPTSSLPQDPPTVDTFGRSTEHSIIPSSPLKLFGKQDTYTTERFRDMLNKIDGSDGARADGDGSPASTRSSSHASLQLLLRNSEELFNKLKNRTQPAQNQEDSDYTDTETAESGVFDSPTPSRPDITASLELLKQKLDLSMSGEVDQKMSVPKIKKRDKRPGIKFIPGDEFKGKVFDKRANKFVPVEEYVPDGDADGGSIDALNEISDLDDEMSFLQAKSRLVAAITEQYPSEDWLRLEKLSLAARRLDKLRDLDRFVPHLRVLDASENELTHTEGIPKSIQVLKASANAFSSMSMFNFDNLQVLELRNNRLTNLRGLKLYNLSMLDVSYNAIDSLQGLQNLKMLKSLKLAGNNLSGSVDFGSLDMLQDLDVDENGISDICGLDALPALTSVSANRNKLAGFRCSSSSLRRLCLSYNNIKELDLEPLTELRVLKIDRNPLACLSGLSDKLVQVSAKYLQSHASNDVLLAPLYRLQKLNLCGSLFPTKGSLSAITVLNLSAMNLETVPDLAKWFPMLTDLDLNFNKIHSLSGLAGLRFLRELKLLSNSIRDLASLVPHTRSFRKTLKLLDLRVNPATHGLYPYVFYDDEPDDESAAEMTLNLKDHEDIEAFSVEYTKLYEKDAMESWTQKNAGYVQQIEESRALARRTYESTLIGWFENINYLDGLWVSYERRERERRHLRYG